MIACKIGLEDGFSVGSILGGRAPLTISAMEGALIELRDLDWRAPSDGKSPFAKDGPWYLAQREVGDIAGHYSETLLVNESGKELQVRKLDTPRPRTPLLSREVDRLEVLRGWLLLLPDVTDRRIVWAASFHLWRGERMDWAMIKVRSGFDRTTTRCAGRYREAVAKLVCRVNGVPERHYRAVMARDAAAFTTATRQESWDC